MHDLCSCIDSYIQVNSCEGEIGSIVEKLLVTEYLIF